jgi:TolB-like protein/DNA-binding winged helix-turn-helix (wHTH) protein/Tfp pilus assembly protein PilF
MNSQPPVFEFGPFRLDTLKRLLWRDGHIVQLTSKSFDTLLALVERRGDVVTKDDLMKLLWPDTVVEENNLTQQISMLRKTLGEKVSEHRYVVTVPGRGYRFVADVSISSKDGKNGLADQPPSPIPNESRTAWQNEAAGSGNGKQRIAGAQVVPSRARRWKIVLSSCLALAAFLTVVYALSTRRSRLERNQEPGRSVAVLPFKPIDNDPANVYLSMGMADAVITRLSNLQQISVRPTSTIIKYAEHQGEAQMIGRELGVDSVLEGTVQKDGNRVRVTVQLVSVQSGMPIWAQRFDQALTDIFAVQDSISEQVAQTMMLKLNVDDQEQIRKRPTENVAAYQEYLAGRYFWNGRDREGLLKSLLHFQRAIELDTNYAQAYSGLADAYTLIAAYKIDSVPDDEAVQKAKAAATRALKLDESLAEAHASLAMIRSKYDHDYRGADSEYRRAIQLNPTYATAHHWYSEYLATIGHESEALSEIILAQTLDPLSPVINTTLGEHLYYARRYDEAVTQLRKTLELSPDFGAAHFILGLALEQQGKLDEAISELQKARANSALDSAADASLGHSYALAGRQRDARRILRELLAKKHSEPYEIAMVYQGLGEKKEVFAWLEKIRRPEAELSMLLRLDPRFDSVRSEQRFQQLL